jgi:predicted transcriptional regulator
MEVKTVDKKGRVLLGPGFAGKIVLVKTTAKGVSITPAVVVPEHEAWLMKNEAAREALNRGLAQAAAGQFAEDPPVIDESWANAEFDEE